MQVKLRKDAFVQLITSCIETYKREDLGVLLGQKVNGNYTIQQAFPFPTAKRKFSSVEPIKSREKRTHDTLESLVTSMTSVIGDFHSHPDETVDPSGDDIEDMEKRKDWMYLIVSVRNSARQKKWSRLVDETLSGTVGEYYIKILALTWNKKKKEFVNTRLICPYALRKGYF